MPSRRALLATCGSAVIAGCSALERDPDGGGSWSQYGADSARTGSRDTGGPEPPLTTAWSYEYDGRSEASISPVVDAGTVYTVYTEDPNADERAVVLAAVDAATGEEQLTATITAVAESPHETMPYADSLALADGAVLVQTANGLFAVDADGDERWQFDNVGDGSIGSLDPFHPGVGDGVVYAGHYRHADESDPVLYAVDLEDGTERWRYDPAERNGGLVYAPAVDDGVVYVAVGGSGLRALDASNGIELWRESVPAYHAPSVASGTVFVPIDTDDAGGVAALDAETGAIHWTRETDDPDARLPAHVAATDGAVYYAAGTHVVARDAATGDRLWIADEPLETDEAWTGITAPAAAGDRLYVIGSELFVFDRTDGRVLGSEPIEASDSSPAVTEELASVSSNRELRALTACETELFGRCLRRG